MAIGIAVGIPFQVQAATQGDVPVNALVTDDSYGLDDGSGNYLTTDDEA